MTDIDNSNSSSLSWLVVLGLVSRLDWHFGQSVAMGRSRNNYQHCKQSMIYNFTSHFTILIPWTMHTSQDARKRTWLVYSWPNSQQFSIITIHISCNHKLWLEDDDTHLKLVTRKTKAAVLSFDSQHLNLEPIVVCAVSSFITNIFVVCLVLSWHVVAYRWFSLLMPCSV